MGDSNRIIEYKCTTCGMDCRRERLVVKRVLYQTMGEGGKTLRSRTVGWLCPNCRLADPDWNRDAITSAPGSADFVKEPV